MICVDLELTRGKIALLLKFVQMGHQANWALTRFVPLDFPLSQQHTLHYKLQDIL